MSQRISALSLYLLRSITISLTGLLYILFALVFYMIFFDPRQQTPDADYYVLVLGLFGALFAFLVTLTVASRANRAVHFPFLVRLPSRIEYLTSVMLASMVFTLGVQFLLGLFAILANGPDFSFRQLMDIPPIWIAGNTLFMVLALHASDLVANGWSRVYVFGVLAVLLYFQSGLGLLADGIAGIFDRLGNAFLTQGWTSIANPAFAFSDWIVGAGSDLLQGLTGIIFWPFSSIANASASGYFSLSQALAPTLLLLYATILFVLAADLFASKDLYLTE
ncbi:MAG: hypothetical protein WA996_10855 [Candidatus Promineifilaceae bacterium]